MTDKLLKVYFKTQDYPFTRHHLESFSHFLSQDLPAIIKAENPFIILQDQIGTTGVYAIKAELYIGGLDGSKIYIGTPSVSLRDSEEIRVLLPNEARLRNLTYASQITADIFIRITISTPTKPAPIARPRGASMRSPSSSTAKSAMKSGEAMLIAVALAIGR